MELRPNLDMTSYPFLITNNILAIEGPLVRIAIPDRPHTLGDRNTRGAHPNLDWTEEFPEEHYVVDVEGDPVGDILGFIDNVEPNDPETQNPQPNEGPQENVNPPEPL